jgi:aspartyl-tRNA(Asn)/glutamyl-tRNA(Gln) amidotransferase subunit C
MVTKEEVKNLANLARIEITESEADSLTSELDSILGYVGQIKDASTEEVLNNPILRNVLREDVPTNKDSEYTEDLLNNAPKREGAFLRVKKIL